MNEQIYINKEPIPLYQVLKLANVVGGGGEAKMLITNGYIFVNGEQALEKRKKVFAGDFVQLEDQLVIEVLLGESSSIENEHKPTEFAPEKPKNLAKAKGRKPISF